MFFYSCFSGCPAGTVLIETSVTLFFVELQLKEMELFEQLDSVFLLLPQFVED